MLVLATTSVRSAMEEQNLTQAFSGHIHVSMMSKPEHFWAALVEHQRLTPQECQLVEQNLAHRQ